MNQYCSYGSIQACLYLPVINCVLHKDVKTLLHGREGTGLDCNEYKGDILLILLDTDRVYSSQNN